MSRVRCDPSVLTRYINVAIRLRWFLFGMAMVSFVAGVITLFYWTSSSFAAISVGVVLLSQWAFLTRRGNWKLQVSEAATPMKLSAAAAGLVGMILTFGFAFTLLEIPNWFTPVYNATFDSRLVGYPVIGVIWAAWAVVFYWSNRREDYLTYRTGILRWLMAGTFLELLVAAPVHAWVYRRESCYCARGSFLGLIFGCTALMWVFGPGICILFLWEQRLRKSLQAKRLERNGGRHEV